mmetsp:Transcript_3905/g.12941  ORF Transcript_3905/g.12941 Transcript_3905/m.12941 type:complete len:219 (-) Transcript_3905:677-1333(-)
MASQYDFSSSPPTSSIAHASPSTSIALPPCMDSMIFAATFSSSNLKKTRLFALFEIDKLDFTVRFKRTFNALAKLDEIVPLHVCFFAQSDSRNHPGRVHNLFLFARFAVVFFVLSSSSSSVVIVVSATFATVVVIIVIVTTIAHHDFPFRSFPLLVQLCVLLRIGRSVRLLLRFLFRLQRLLLLLLLQILLLKHQRQLRAFVHQRVGHSRHLFRALLR